MATPPTFSTGAVLTAAQMNAVGLWKVASTTFSGSSGVEIQNCFSADYLNYKVYVTYYGSAAGSNSNFQYMTGTNTKDIAATYDRWGFFWNVGINNFNGLNNTSNFISNHTNSANRKSLAEITIYEPNVANVNTTCQLRGWSADSGLATYLDHSKNTNSQYTGLYFFPGTGTITGTITVYGMR